MQRTNSMLELSDMKLIRRYSSKLSLDESGRSSLPSISETESLSYSGGTGNASTCAFLPMDSSMSRGIRGGLRSIIVVEEPDDDDHTFFLGIVDIDEEQPQHAQRPQPETPEDSDAYTKLHENRAALKIGGNGEESPQKPTLVDKSGLSASLPNRFSSSSPGGVGVGLRRVASGSCLKRANSEDTIKKPKRTISFANLEIREYDLTIGDNPSVSYGPPVQLSWQYSESQTRCLEEYESEKLMDRSRGRRSSRVENISWVKREALLKRQGFSQNDIEANMKEVNKVKQGRSLTRALVITGRAEEALESAGRKLKRFFGNSSESKDRRTIRPIIDDSTLGDRASITSTS
eukprot:CAMPEP_0181022466 /NCGR_PEP_ID=MMETSP1070-20121207/1527_1 /TAXON_ID=265543 /ORGANISM="Minutocellus polymorphus, Strain NH13" /LENGTH=346 /DNA_ID=CAMNT_0023099405 /DNA_START=31 /DNA_END=1071 /DNA_ORIENTATION=+